MYKSLYLNILLIILLSPACKCTASERSKNIQDTIYQASTTIPVTQSRDSKHYNWLERHQNILRLNQKDPPENVIIGNSIIHYWGGEPGHRIKRGETAWNKYLAPFGARNLGFGSDRIENVLWRVNNGELDGFEAENIVILIGTNNLKINSDNEIIEGLAHLIDAVREKQAAAKITLSALLPRRDMEERIRQLNNRIEKLAGLKKTAFIDPGKVFLQKNNKIDENLFSDGLHPNETGYEKLGALLGACFRNKK